MDYEIMMNGNVKIGSIAPDIDATSTKGNINLNNYKGKWILLFSHPRRLYTSMYNRDNSFCKSKYIF